MRRRIKIIIIKRGYKLQNSRPDDSSVINRHRYFLILDYSSSKIKHDLFQLDLL